MIIAKNTTIHGKISVENKEYSYSIRNLWPRADAGGEDLYRLICRKAKFSQDYPARDIDDALLALETIIEMQDEELQTAQIGFRISVSDKKIIEENAGKYGFSSVSDFLKTLGKSPEYFLHKN